MDSDLNGHLPIRYWTTERKGAWKVIADTPEDLAQAIANGAMFVTMWNFSQEPVEGEPEPNRQGDLVLDFDDKDAPVNAHSEVMRVTAHLEKIYGVDPYMLHYFASGSKGFHLSIPAETFGATKGDPYLPLIFKRVAAKLAADCDLNTLDLSIFNMKRGRMIRLPNVQRSNGKYKIPLACSEMSLPAEQLLALTKEPRALDEDNLPEPPQETEMAELYRQCCAQVHADVARAAEHEPMSAEQRELLRQNIPSCINYILDKRPTSQPFNTLCLQLVAYCSDAGHTLDEALDLCGDFLAKRNSDTYGTIEKRRRHFRELFLYVQGGDHYPFGCQFILGMEFPGHAFECKQCPCNPDKKPSRSEIEQVIADCDDVDELTSTILLQVAESGLPKSMKHRLQKLIAKKAGCTIKDLKADEKTLLGDDAPAAEKTVLECAKEIITLLGKENVLTDTISTWRWRNRGVWEKTEDREVRQFAHRVVDDPDVSKGHIDSVLDVFKTETFRPGHRFDLVQEAVNVLNGELHWTGERWELRQHCREHYRTTQLPVAYDPNAGAHRFLQFLQEVFRGDPDANHKIALVFQAIGYTVTASTALEAFFLLYGMPAAGKSVLLAIVEALCGRNNVCAVQPSLLENEFHRAHMHGKLANIVTEIGEGAEIADAQLKAIVSGELTTASHKFKPPFDFRPFCTCWFGTNHMPHCRDFSNALQRRAFILRFNRTFTPEERDPRLKDKLLEELPGILAIALEAYGDVLRSGHFTVPESCEDARRQWRMESDQVVQFLDECCQLAPDASVQVQELFDDYRAWAEIVGIRRTLNRRNFTDRVRLQGVVSWKSTGGWYRFAGIHVVNKPLRSSSLLN